jgi:predicted house-cleaning noncanonical NTP pyrophosphatase (MazG superfamily)
MKHSKLVRDKIPGILKAKCINSITHTASDEEYWNKLKEKLQEETGEFIKNENNEELADILEVVYAICGYKKIDREGLEMIRKKKAKEKGIFKDKIILDGTE